VAKNYVTNTRTRREKSGAHPWGKKPPKILGSGKGNKDKPKIKEGGIKNWEIQKRKKKSGRARVFENGDPPPTTTRCLIKNKRSRVFPPPTPHEGQTWEKDKTVTLHPETSVLQNKNGGGERGKNEEGGKKREEFFKSQKKSAKGATTPKEITNRMGE